MLKPFDFQPLTRLVFGEGALARVGELARAERFTRTLLVADPGVAATDSVDRAAKFLAAAGIQVARFHDFGPNPDSRMVEQGRLVAAAAGVDSIVALGGGSSLDCAKGINFLLAGGGSMRDYRGFGKARGTMVPSIGIPTTAGTGSEAQTYAIISDADTHEKMACGDRGAAFRVAILDPELTVSAPREVTAVAGYDAISHAVESYVTTKRTPVSDLFARDAWRLLAANYERVLEQPSNVAARGAMLLGAHEAGIAIENSMLGATHACANPLTARYSTTHGVAIAVMLPHVVRWNAACVGDRYLELAKWGRGYFFDGPEHKKIPPSPFLGDQLAELARIGCLPATLKELGVPREDLPALAADAARQWTGTFNPRPFDAAAALALYERAF